MVEFGSSSNGLGTKGIISYTPAELKGEIPPKILSFRWNNPFVGNIKLEASGVTMERKRVGNNCEIELRFEVENLMVMTGGKALPPSQRQYSSSSPTPNPSSSKLVSTYEFGTNSDDFEATDKNDVETKSADIEYLASYGSTTTVEEEERTNTPVIGKSFVIDNVEQVGTPVEAVIAIQAVDVSDGLKGTIIADGGKIPSVEELWNLRTLITGVIETSYKAVKLHLSGRNDEGNIILDVNIEPGSSIGKPLSNPALQAAMEAAPVKILSVDIPFATVDTNQPIDVDTNIEDQVGNQDVEHVPETGSTPPQ